MSSVDSRPPDGEDPGILRAVGRALLGFVIGTAAAWAFVPPDTAQAVIAIVLPVVAALSAWYWGREVGAVAAIAGALWFGYAHTEPNFHCGDRCAGRRDPHSGRPGRRCPGQRVGRCPAPVATAPGRYREAVSSGKLRVFLGAAPGVGKTYAMLEEGHRLRDLGKDVVIAYVEPHARTDTIAMIGDLEIVPRKQIEYRGSTFEEMDLEAVLQRAPKVALVDELAHTNIPGSQNVKRWQDVEALLDAGIDVLSTLNIQHLESLNDVVFEITDITQRETIPDEVVRRASEIELVDLTQEGIRERMASGKIYPAERIDAALGNYFRPGNLGALRELALSWTADRVDEAVAKYRSLHGIEQPVGDQGTSRGRHGRRGRRG